MVKVVHGASRRTYYFAGTSASEMERWAELMAQAAREEDAVLVVIADHHDI